MLITRALAFSCLVLGASAANSQDSAPCPSPWTSVSLLARKGPMKARVDLNVAPGSVDDLVACPASDGRNPPDACLVVLDSTTDAPFNAPIHTKTWLSPTAGVLQVETWDGKIHRRSRECVSGRHAWRWERRRKDEEILVRERHRDAPAGGNALPVVDATSLVWLAAANRLDREGATLDAAAWSGDQLLKLKLTAMESSLLRRDDEDDEGGIRARRVEIALADDEDGDDESASGAAPFGMCGPVSLWLEEGTGVPLLLDGRSKKVGRIRAFNSSPQLRW